MSGCWEVSFAMEEEKGFEDVEEGWMNE